MLLATTTPTLKPLKHTLQRIHHQHSVSSYGLGVLYLTSCSIHINPIHFTPILLFYLSYESLTPLSPPPSLVTGTERKSTKEREMEWERAKKNKPTSKYHGLKTSQQTHTHTQTHVLQLPHLSYCRERRPIQDGSTYIHIQEGVKTAGKRQHVYTPNSK